jgi:C4-dicarboxylate-specific signal transduction histidine kinase
LQLEDVIADVLALARRELVERRIMVRTEVAEDFPSVLGDPVEIQQVFLNVVMNGVDAMSALEQERRIMTICGQRIGQRRELEGKPAVLITLRDLGGGFRPRRTRMGFLNLSIHQTARHGHGVCESAVP